MPHGWSTSRCNHKKECSLLKYPFRPWEVVGADIFKINNGMLLCIVDYYSKFPVVMKVGTLAADDLLQMAKMTFAEYGLPKEILSDRGTKFN